MIDYLQKKGGYTSSGLTKEEKLELENLRNEVKKYREFESAIMEEHNEEDLSDEEEKENSVSKSHSDSQSDEEDVVADEEIKKRQAKKSKHKRTGVSAEAYGKFNKKEDFVPRIIQKTEEQINKIKARIVSSFLFSNLEPNELEIVIGAMDEKHLKPGENVITQGESGDCLYVVEEGNLDCTKHFTQDGEEKYLKTYVPGESFGELALLYNAPRAATIKAKTDSLLWALDRQCFNNIVKDAAIKKREKYENTLKKVDILSTIDVYELGQICDALKTETVPAGTRIIQQDEEGDKFYILDDGKAHAAKVLEPGKPEETVLEYQKGGYFGELALLKNEPRAASVIADTDCKLLTLDRMAFKRLLGPLENLLQRNSEAYVKYMKK
jgi:cAMP-dependent protein kinase regulator